jgi:hypothetical protein
VLASLSWGRFDPSAGLVTKINARDRWGRTALDLAIVGGHKEVEVLLSAHEAIAVAREEEEPCDLLPACEKPPRGCPLLQMPTEMLVLILSWLEPRDLCAVAQTCSVLPPHMSCAHDTRHTTHDTRHTTHDTYVITSECTPQQQAAVPAFPKIGRGPLWGWWGLWCVCVCVSCEQALEEASRDNALWRRFCDEEHALPGGQSWKDCYREWFVPHLRAYAGTLPEPRPDQSQALTPSLLFPANRLSRTTPDGGQVIKWLLLGELCTLHTPAPLLLILRSPPPVDPRNARNGREAMPHRAVCV